MKKMLLVSLVLVLMIGCKKKSTETPCPIYDPVNQYDNYKPTMSVWPIVAPEKLRAPVPLWFIGQVVERTKDSATVVWKINDEIFEAKEDNHGDYNLYPEFTKEGEYTVSFIVSYPSKTYQVEQVYSVLPAYKTVTFDEILIEQLPYIEFIDVQKVYLLITTGKMVGEQWISDTLYSSKANYLSKPIEVPFSFDLSDIPLEYRNRYLIEIMSIRDIEDLRMGIFSLAHFDSYTSDPYPESIVIIDEGRRARAKLQIGWH
jgi:hypothetical protein